jgi:hypothetical protein
MIIFDKEKNCFDGAGSRPGFDDSVKKLRKRNRDLCHRISYYTIERGICNALNWLLNYKEDWGKGAFDWGMGHIAGMILSVYGERGSFSDIDKENKEDQLKRIEEQVPNWNNMVTKEYSELYSQVSKLDNSDYSGIIEAANDLLYWLNSCRNNLRPGNSSWNRSVGSAYDPSDWEYDTVNNIFILSKSDSIQITNLLHFTMGKMEDVSNSVDAVFFYSAKANDEEILYSSQNGSVLVGDLAYNPCTSRIVYWDYVERTMKPIEIDETNETSETN